MRYRNVRNRGQFLTLAVELVAVFVAAVPTGALIYDNASGALVYKPSAADALVYDGIETTEGDAQ